MDNVNQYHQNLEFLFNHTSDVIWSVDVDLRLICANHSFNAFINRITGSDPIIGQSVLYSEFGEESLLFWKEKYQESLNGQMVVFELSDPRSDFSVAEVKMNPIVDAKGKVMGVGCFVRDISQYKQKEREALVANEKLYQSEMKYKALINTSSDIILITDEHGIRRYISPAVEPILGYTQEEMINESVFDLVHPDDLEEIMAQFTRAVANPNDNTHVKLRFKHKDGSWRYLSITGSNQLENDAVKGMVANIRDITELELANQKVQASEKFFRTLLEYTPNGAMAVLGLDYRIKYTGGHDFKVFDLDPQSIIGTHYPSNFGETLRPFVEGRLAQIVKGKSISYEIAYNGHQYWVSGQPIYNDAGEVTELILIAQNITELKRVEDALRESEEKFRKLSENSPVGIFQLAPSGYCTWMNERTCDICGFDLADGLGFGFNDFIFPDDRERVRGTFLRSVANQEATPLMTYRILTHDRQAKWVYTQAAPLRNNHGEVVSYVGTIEDISELKHYQDELIESRNQLEKVLNNMPDGVVYLDNDWTITYVNSNACNILNFQKKDLLGWNMWQRFPDAVGTVFEENYLNARKSGQPFTITEYFAPIEKWIKVNGIPNNEGFLVFFQDVSDKKDLENHIETIYEMSPAMLGIVDRTFHFANFNPALGNILGYNDEELHSKPFYEFVHPDDRPNAVVAARQIMGTEGTTKTFENRYRTKDGDYKWISWSVYGQPSRKLAYFVAQDVTIKKQEEEYLRMLESVVINTKDSVVITEARPIEKPGPRIVYVNPAFEEATGYSKEEAIGQSPRILQGTDTDSAELKKIKAALENWQPYRGELKNYKKDGTPFWVSLSIIPIADNKGWFTHWVSVQRDITEIKLAELKLTEFAKQQESLAILGYTLASMSNLAEIYSSCANMLLQTLGMDIIKIATINNTDQTLDEAYSIGLAHSGKKKVKISSTSHTGHCLSTGKEVIVSDYSGIDAFQPSQALLKGGAKSGAAVLLHGNDGPQGVLGVYSRSTREYSTDEVNYIKAVANILTSAIKRVETNEQLNLSEKKYRLLFDENPLPLWIYDPITLYFKDVNEAAIKQYGYTRNEFLSMKISDIRPKEDIPRLLEVIRQAKHIPYSSNGWRHRRKNGEIIDVEIASNPIVINGVEHRLSLSNDVTHKKQLEAEREKYQEQLELTVAKRTSQLLESNRELEAFNYTVSHDLRTPVRAIQMFVTLLERECELSETCKDFTSNIRVCTEEMTNLINDLLEFSRIRKQDMDMTEVDMHSLAKSVADNLLSIEERKDLQINIKPLPVVKGDKTLLKSVWQNLVSNAIKYSRNSSPIIVTISSKIKKDKVEFCVEDNGIGFDMQYAPKLFKPFSRLHSSSEYKGTGAGLAIVHRIISRHKGNVSVNSELGKGSKFYFYLPLHTKN